MKLASSLLMIGLAVAAFAQQGTNQVSAEKLKKLKAEYTTAKTAFTKKPKDAKVKKKYVDATYAVGLGTMYGDGLTPREKYAGALAYFREVMKVEPKHKGAKDNYDMIAKIYRQMGKPVPGENPPGK